LAAPSLRLLLVVLVQREGLWWALDLRRASYGRHPVGLLWQQPPCPLERSGQCLLQEEVRGAAVPRGQLEELLAGPVRED